jgi:hypothetical protein
MRRIAREATLANEPVGRRVLAKELAKVAAACISPTREGLRGEAWVSIMVEELESYPAKAVVEALQYWRRAEKWLPSLSEILYEVQWRSERRQAMLNLKAEVR